MRNKGRYFAVVTLAAAFALVAGCTRKPQATDAQTATDVQTKIYSDPSIQSRQIGVQAADGVVTLTGDVTSDTERTTAASDAAAVGGVKTVVNNLQIQQAQSAPAKPKSRRAQNDQTSSRHHKKSTDSDNDIDAGNLPPAPPAPEPAPAPQQTPPPPPPPPQNTSLSVNGKTYNVQTNQWTRAGSGEGKKTATKVGVGTAAGAILGGIIGGGRGAAIGAASGAGAGTGVAAAKKGQQIKLAPEAVLSFQTINALTVMPQGMNGHNNGRTPLS
jgi:hypothetical protein